MSRQIAEMNAEEYTHLMRGIARHVLQVGGTRRLFDSWVRAILHGLHAGGYEKERLHELRRESRRAFSTEQTRLVGHKFDWIARGALEGGITLKILDGTLIWRKDTKGQYELRRRDRATAEEIQQWEELASREPYVTGTGQVIRLEEIDRTGVSAAVNNLDAPKRWKEELRGKLGEQAAARP